MATFTPGFWLALGMLGEGKAVLRSIFLDVTKMCSEMFAGTIMCYGQTGAGKTYTMTGATENYKHRGILPRALQQVERGPMSGMAHRSCPSQASSWSKWDPGLQGAAACRGDRLCMVECVCVCLCDPGHQGAAAYRGDRLYMVVCVCVCVCNPPRSCSL